MSSSGADFRMDPATDPRTIITPDAFQVAPELLGLALARPWRRAVAILIDLALVALLANARAVFLALAAGVFVFWLAIRRRQTGDPPSCVRRAARGTLGCMGATTLTVVVLVTWFAATADPEKVPATLSGIGDVITLARGGDSVTVAAVGAAIEALTAQPPNVGTDDTVELDTLLARYWAARTAADTMGMRRYGSVLGSELATEELAERDSRIARLQARNKRLDDQLTRSREELDAERSKGIVNSLIGMLDELGLGLGWSGLYFTFFLGFWRGRTPGKRILRVRVVRLDGRPLGYWVSFERFGGYAASLFTGLEGFARILWDRNRQTLEDKLAATVVIRDTKEARRRVAGLHKRA